jgi:RHS repeat-associated protein
VIPKVVQALKSALAAPAPSEVSSPKPDSHVKYTFDQLGSVRELVDSAGVVRADYRYSTYGERTKVDGDLEADFGFGGLFHHGPSGLDLATFRTYDSKAGRWLSRDPLGEGVDYNLYRYCGNNPISYIDPDGLRRGGILGQPTVAGGASKIVFGGIKFLGGFAAEDTVVGAPAGAALQVSGAKDMVAGTLEILLATHGPMPEEPNQPRAPKQEPGLERFDLKTRCGSKGPPWDPRCDLSLKICEKGARELVKDGPGLALMMARCQAWYAQCKKGQGPWAPPPTGPTPPPISEPPMPRPSL